MLPKTINLQLRTALTSDTKALELLIAESLRKLGILDYSSEQIESALKTACGLDTQLITDQTFYVVESGRLLVGCGGWSYRQTLFGSDAEQSRSLHRIDPETGAARIRAFFVKPAYSRMGIGSMIMHRCEQEALHAGFRRLELMATLSGIKLYLHHGFVMGEPFQYPLDGQLTIKFVSMFKEISTRPDLS